MAIMHGKFLCYLSKVLTGALNGREAAYIYDPLFALWEECQGKKADFSCCSFTEKQLGAAISEYRRHGFIGVMRGYFENTILDQFTDNETERQVVALKAGYPRMPATTCSIIMRGFGRELTDRDVLRIYASHGLVNGMRELAREFDFIDINRRAKELSHVIEEKEKEAEFLCRYKAMRSYLLAEPGKREAAIRSCGINRSLFFHYWKRFCRYGLLGLADTGNELFRRGKTGMKNESRIIINKLQNQERSNISYVNFLKSRDIVVDPSTISKIFKRWKVNTFKSKFIHNLKRLEDACPETREPTITLTPSLNPVRHVDERYLHLLLGMGKNGMATDSPGLFVIWYYLEKLELFPVLEKLGLSLPENEKGYSWLDLLLLNIARTFYGISSYTGACEHPEPSPSFFAGLVKSPCNDSLLNGLEKKITEKQVYQLRKWLIDRACELGLIDMKRTAMDFHQIDLDVILGKLRNFGKGPSPKKKICHEGFRPHILWDVGTGCPIVIEFRKSSARGTTTAVPFLNDYIPEELKKLFETVYVDSEYTGKNLWQFILGENGLKADLTACFKQNAFVKKERDRFLGKHQNEPGFWKYYDDEHVYSSRTFELKWEYTSGKKSEKKRILSLKCVVKKKLKDGKLRCFGTSKKKLGSREILSDYSVRWIVENGIKDLITSYFLDNCPGSRPHLVDIHFLTISICRIIYKMIENDMGKDIRNTDGTIKTMERMRELLFRQGAGKIFYKNGVFNVKFSNSHSPKMTAMLNKLYRRLETEYQDGLTLLGGAKLKFSMAVPYGEDYRNNLDKVPLIVNEKNHGKSKNR